MGNQICPSGNGIALQDLFYCSSQLLFNEFQQMDCWFVYITVFFPHALLTFW